MPTWAYIYCGFVILGTYLALIDKDRLRRSYIVAGDILDGLCCIVVFLIAFKQVSFEHAKWISTIGFVYTFAWSYHAHRHYLAFTKFKADLASTLNEDNDENDSPAELNDTQATYWYIGVIALLIGLLLPYCYVYLLSIGAVNG